MSHPAPLRLLLWRARVPITTVLLLACAAVAVAALRSPPADVLPVVVTDRPLEAGSVLGSRDVRIVSWPARLVPEGTHDDAAQVEGRSLAVPVPAGMPLTRGVLADDALWASAPEGSVAAPVRLMDTELAAMLRAGDRVDVFSVAHEGGPAERVARRALVLKGAARPEGADGGLFGTGAPAPSGLVVLAVTSSEAAALAGRGATGSVTAVLVQ